MIDGVRLSVIRVRGVTGVDEATHGGIHGREVDMTIVSVIHVRAHVCIHVCVHICVHTCVYICVPVGIYNVHIHVARVEGGGGGTNLLEPWGWEEEDCVA